MEKRLFERAAFPGGAARRRAAARRMRRASPLLLCLALLLSGCGAREEPAAAVEGAQPSTMAAMEAVTSAAAPSREETPAPEKPAEEEVPAEEPPAEAPAEEAPRQETPPNPQPKEETEVPWMLRVNLDTNVVTVYGLDESGGYTVPEKAMLCSTGEGTPAGVFTMGLKSRWTHLVYDTWGQYISQIRGNILFHTVPALWKGEDGVQTEEFNKLGTTCSAGCVRLTTADAWWIYTYCPAYKTRIEIGRYGAEGDPLGRPAVIRLPTDTATGWDPYDTGPAENPWNEKGPYFTGLRDLTLPAGAALSECLQGVAGFDTCGNDQTDQIAVSCEGDLASPGVYTVYYRLTDLLGRQAEEAVTVTVVPAEEYIPPVSETPAVSETPVEGAASGFADESAPAAEGEPSGETGEALPAGESGDSGEEAAEAPVNP